MLGTACCWSKEQGTKTASLQEVRPFHCWKLDFVPCGGVYSMVAATWCQIYW